jgi:hypothetical protein
MKKIFFVVGVGDKKGTRRNINQESLSNISEDE